METKRKAVLPGVKQLVPRRLWGMADLKGHSLSSAQPLASFGLCSLASGPVEPLRDFTLLQS